MGAGGCNHKANQGQGLVGGVEGEGQRLGRGGAEGGEQSLCSGFSSREEYGSAGLVPLAHSHQQHPSYPDAPHPHPFSSEMF